MIENTEESTAPGVSALGGLKVLELGSLIAGPYAASLFAQFGAEVIKIEPPKIGDPLRKWRKLHGDTSLWWFSQSRNKKSITLNLKDPEAQAIVRKLVADCDVVIENFRPGTLERWGLGWEHLSEINPALVMMRVSGYGQTGPYAGRPGFAAIAEAIGGLRYLIGYPDRAPVRTGVSMGDTLASLYGVVGTMMALYHLKVNGGKGQVVDVSLVESILAVTESMIPEYGMFGEIRERTGASLPGIAPSNTYPTKDGRHLVIAANADSIYQRLMKAIGRTDLAENEKFSHNDGRAANSDELDEALSHWSSGVTLSQALAVLEAASVPASGINNIADVFKDPHLLARKMIEQFNLPDGQAVHIPGAVPRLTATPATTRWLGPALGADNQAVLQSIGITDEQINEMQKRGVL